MHDQDQTVDLKAVRGNVDRETPTVIFFSQNDSLLLLKGFIIHGLRLKSMGMLPRIDGIGFKTGGGDDESQQGPEKRAQKSRLEQRLKTTVHQEAE